MGTLDGFEKVCADFLCRDGEAFENLLLPDLEGLSLLGELIAEAFDLELEIGVADGVVVKVAVVSPFVPVRELQGAPLSLIASGGWVRWIIRKV